MWDLNYSRKEDTSYIYEICMKNLGLGEKHFTGTM
jgi:hypothetical protein